MSSISANIGTSDSSAGGSIGGTTEAGTLFVRDDLASWNPNVGCLPELVTVAHILGSAYPDQSLSGSPYQKDATTGGVPHPRDLTPPCTMTNVTGQLIGTFVQVENVYLSSYGQQTSDCSNQFKGVNGGGPYPNNATICDNLGVILAAGTTSGFMQAEIDQDWLAAGYCGPGVSWCDNETLAQYVSDGSISLHFQGFVFWDGENWELHPVTAWKLAPSSNFPRGIHLSYLDDPTSAVVTWHTSEPSVAWAEWGPTAGGPYPSSATGVSHTSPGGSYLHDATLTDLTPGTRYFYRVGNGSADGTSAELSFRAALPKGSTESFTFAAAGDWGDTLATDATARGIGTRNPDLVVPLGDLYVSPNETVIKRVFDRFQAFGQGSFVQFVIGNHEYPLSNTSHTPTEVHCAFVNQIGNERTYAFTYGNTLFAAIDWGINADITDDGVDATGSSCGGAPGSAAIRSWLDATLAAANEDPQIKWKVVLQHYPCYDVTTEGHSLLCPDGSQSVDQEEEILNARGVDLVLNAHEHSYGRTHPVSFHSAAQGGTNYDTPGAPIYFILGTAGAGHIAGCRSEAWIALCRATIQTEGFGHFTVSSTTIRYEFVDNVAGVVDAFTLTKTPPGDYSVRLEPSSLEMRAETSTNVQVDVIGASASPVTLSVTGCPAATSCTLDTTTGAVPFSATLRIDAGSDAPVGTHDVVVTATNATGSRSAVLALTITGDLTVTFTKGDGGPYSETDDVYIYSGAPDTNFGADPKLFVDESGCLATGTVCKTLIKFPSIIGPNAGQVPSGVLVPEAWLDLTITNKGVTQDLYQVTQSWSESGATWNGFSPAGSPATKPREFAFAPTVFGRFSINITSIVQRWASGEANEGILLASTSSDGVDYDSSEGTNKPTLRVTFRSGSVGPSFDFSIAANPSSGSVAAGGTATTTVTATLLSGSTHDVQYACADLPAGTTCAFTPPACSPTCSASLSIQTSSGTPSGTHTITIAASDGALSRSTTFSLTVSDTSILTFQKGDGGPYSETDDVYIYSGAPDTNFGADPKLFVDESGCLATGTVCKTLIKFPSIIGPNAGQIAAGSMVVDARLELWITNKGVTQDLYQVTQSWSESGATWNGFSPAGSPATKPREFAFAPTVFGRFSINITSVMQRWVDGEANEGILLSSTSADGVDYDSSEGTNKPILIVTFRSGSIPPPSFDFSIAANPSSGSVAAGGTATTTVTATLLSGSTHDVQFGCTDLPAGTTCAFTPPACSPTCSASLTIQTSSGTPSGSHVITILASDGALSRSTTFSLTVSGTSTLTFQRGDGGAYSETDDAFITSSSSTTNFGANTALRVDGSGCTKRRGICRTLIMFPDFIGPNAGQVPSGASIASAILQLTVTDAGGTLELFQIAERWNESGVTWNAFAVPGSPGTKGATIVFAASPKGTVTVDITSIVQAWVNGDSNFGVLLRTASTDLAVFGSSESASRPKLTVTFGPSTDGQVGSTASALSAPPHEPWSVVSAAGRGGALDLTLPLFAVAVGQGGRGMRRWSFILGLVSLAALSHPRWRMVRFDRRDRRRTAPGEDRRSVSLGRGAEYLSPRKGKA